MSHYDRCVGLPQESFLLIPKNVTFSAFKLQVAVFLSFLQLCPKLFK
jgi:hypothetical protein